MNDPRNLSNPNPDNPSTTPSNSPSSPPNNPPGEQAKELSPREIGPSGSETLLPNDHLELLIELMRAGSIELARRWVSVLMLVPESERETIVEAVEAQIVADYCSSG
jgi:hypothetical protein